jgi:hypothetical protein
MKPMSSSVIAALAAPSKLVKTATLAGVLMIFAPGVVLGAPIEKKGTTSYVTHFVFVPLGSIDVPGVGKVTSLEATGPTENMKGEPAFDKMKARCFAVNIESGEQKWIDGACTLTDTDGDIVFSTFDTRDLDKADPKMDCGTHTVKGGTGKYKGITGREPFACISKPAPSGGPPGAMAMDIPHNTTWEIK